MEVVHLGKGVVVNKSEHDKIISQLSQSWPYDYGSKKINSRSDRAVRTHMMVYDNLIWAVWPSLTHAKYYAIEGFPGRADFHKDRVDVCVGKHTDMGVGLLCFHL